MATQPTSQDSHPDALITERDAAMVLCVSDRTLQQWRWRGIGPRYLKLCGGAVRYTRADLLDFIASSRCQSDE